MDDELIALLDQLPNLTPLSMPSPRPTSPRCEDPPDGKFPFFDEIMMPMEPRPDPPVSVPSPLPLLTPDEHLEPTGSNSSPRPDEPLNMEACCSRASSLRSTSTTPPPNSTLDSCNPPTRMGSSRSADSSMTRLPGEDLYETRIASLDMAIANSPVQEDLRADAEREEDNDDAYEELPQLPEEEWGVDPPLAPVLTPGGIPGHVVESWKDGAQNTALLTMV